MRTLSYFLGMEVTKTANGLHLCQKEYILDLLINTAMHEATLMATMACPCAQSVFNICNTFNDPALYWRVVGTL